MAQTNGHGNSMTDPAQRAESVKMPGLIEIDLFHFSCYGCMSLLFFLVFMCTVITIIILFKEMATRAKQGGQ